MASPNDIKKSTVINYEGGLWQVVEFQRVSPGKGSSFVRTRMKNLENGKVQEVAFKSGEALTFEDVSYKKLQFIFKDTSGYTFMDVVSYEQHAIDESIIGDDAKYLKEGLDVSGIMHNDRPIAIQLPQKVQYEVTQAPPAVKGDTASGNVTKKVTLDNGLEAQVPIFIKQGDHIVINTETGSYAERVSR